ncbi:glycosyltransferase family 2 protein [Actinomycetaceae bacterium MB13-C1-2]|nr:glycosyltransferase family 2 protein [Actinomycetaceae bacterium MB13-C1-2]
MNSLVSVVVVTFNPNPVALKRLLTALRPQVNSAIVVDNGSSNQATIRDLAKEYGATLICSEENIGIAAAQNVGIEHALRNGADHVLLSDQDSVPAPNMVQQLMQCLGEQSSLPHSRPVAAIGPVPVDERGNRGDALVYSFTTWGPKRREIPEPGDVLEVPFVLASGCLIPRAALIDVGPMNEGLFIDHVDLAWCLRAIQKGYRVLACGDARLTHELGEETTRLPGGREVHVQSPMRAYFMVRNTLLLMRAPFMPLKWKLGYIPYLTKYIGFYTLAPGRERRVPQMVEGLWDGITGKTGPFQDD